MPTTSRRRAVICRPRVAQSVFDLGGPQWRRAWPAVASKAVTTQCEKLPLSVDGSVNSARRPDNRARLEPEHAAVEHRASSSTIERPRPEPGFDSSSRWPRLDGRGAVARRARPGPSSSMVTRKNGRAVAASLERGTDPDRDLAPRPFPGIVDEVADHLLEILTLAEEADAGVRRSSLEGRPRGRDRSSRTCARDPRRRASPPSRCRSCAPRPRRAPVPDNR